MKEMTPSKEWMCYTDDRLNEKYKLGVEQFLDYAFKKTGEEHNIRCPCNECNNTGYGSRDVVGMHLLVHGINYVLKNCDLVQSFHEEYSHISNKGQDVTNDQWNVHFINWFKKKVEKLPMQDQNTKSDELLSLARGPAKYVTCFSGFIVNGYRFRIEERDNGCRTQNSGVCVIGDIGSGENYIDYYGVLEEVVELQYLSRKCVVLFRCRWFDVYDKEKGVRNDEYGFTSVNCHRFLKTNEPFILATQASQVFYATDNIKKDWNVVVKTQPRDLYELPNKDEDNNVDDLDEAYQHGESFTFECSSSTLLEDNQDIWKRTDLEPMVHDVSEAKGKKKRKRKAT